MTKDGVDTALALAGFITLSAYTLTSTWSLITIVLMPAIILTAICLRKPQIAYLLPLFWAFSLTARPQNMSLQNIFAYMFFGIIPLLLTTQAAITYAGNRKIMISYGGTIAAFLPIPVIGLFITVNEKNFINTSAEMLSTAGIFCLMFVSIIGLALIASIETRKS